MTRGWTERWVAGFARGLAADQRRFGITLCGGDTTGTPGPTTISITAFGKVAPARGWDATARGQGTSSGSAARSATRALGLLAARGELKSAVLEKRYRLPQPRTTLGPRLVGIASATADISDGLLADAGHIADASRLAARIEREQVPLSAAARSVLSAKPSLWRKCWAAATTTSW